MNPGPSSSPVTFLRRVRWRNVALVLMVAAAGYLLWQWSSQSNPVPKLPTQAAVAVSEPVQEVPVGQPASELSPDGSPARPRPSQRKNPKKKKQRKYARGKARRTKKGKSSAQRQPSGKASRQVTQSAPQPLPTPSYSPPTPPSPSPNTWEKELTPG